MKAFLIRDRNTGEFGNRLLFHREEFYSEYDELYWECVPVEVKEIDTKKEFYKKSFEEFWKRYPRRVVKSKALEYWLKLKPSTELVEIIFKDIKRRMEHTDWGHYEGTVNEKYIPYPQKYINQKMWESEINTKKKDVDDWNEYSMTKRNW